MILKKRGFNLVLISCYLFFPIISLFGQSNGLAGDGVREEVQRYLGYEDLLYRFISLPFDMTMNSNVSGFYLDIGLLFLTLLPLLFFVNQISLLEKWGIAALLLFMLIITLPNNYHQQTKVPFDQIDIEVKKQINFGNRPIWSPYYAQLKAIQIANIFFQPIDKQLKKITGERDYVTLPLLLLTWIWLLSIIYRCTKKQSKILQSILIFTAIYGFLWFYLSIGIVWYGILFFPMAIVFILKGIQSIHWIKKGAVFGFVGLWFLLSFAYRLSDYRPYNEITAKGLIDKNTLLYQSGAMSKTAYLDTYFPYYSVAIDSINREDTSSILVVNTMLPFYISNYENRAIKDGNLGGTIRLVEFYPDKVERAKVMRAYGIRYVLFGLKTADLDKTPEQSLVKKSNLMLNFLRDNEQINLLATDQKIINESGEIVNRVFGTSVHTRGTFALFELK